MTTILDDMVQHPPSEFGGPRATNRLGYQRDWTFSLLLKLHLTGADYLVIVDYHDDVMVLDGETTPTRVDFYQVKTDSSSRWTIKGLLHRKKGSKTRLPSILGKLYKHRLDFPAAKTLNFVANLPFNVQLDSSPPAESRASFSVVDLAPAELSKVKAALTAEISKAGHPVLDAMLVFHVSDLSLHDHAAHSKGRLAEYLEQRDPSGKHSIPALYRTLVDEITRRAEWERPCMSVVDLVALKGISRASFESMLASLLLAERPGPREVASRLDAELSRDGLHFVRRMQLCRGCERYGIERMHSSRLDLARLSQLAKDYCDRQLPSHTGSLADFLALGARSLATSFGPGAPADDYIQGALAWEMLTQ